VKFRGASNLSSSNAVLLIESAYENEHDISTTRVRAEAYHALLSGASGQVFGNNPMWNFNGRPPQDWVLVLEATP
jgi:hypothetical protein